jgi:hypothetical protein
MPSAAIADIPENASTTREHRMKFRLDQDGRNLRTFVSLNLNLTLLHRAPVPRARRRARCYFRMPLNVIQGRASMARRPAFTAGSPAASSFASANVPTR